MTRQKPISALAQENAIQAKVSANTTANSPCSQDAPLGATT